MTLLLIFLVLGLLAFVFLGFGVIFLTLGGLLGYKFKKILFSKSNDKKKYIDVEEII